MEQLLKDTLEQRFGMPQFREGQLEAISTLMTKGRALCILPTGYGKSLLYQLPACLLDGITIVISPLLALMRDQIDHLNRRFGIPAMAINSDQTDEENYAARQAALGGRLRILFIAPEQLDHVDRFNFLLNLKVQMVVVDEAHCISTWGHDFRPSYRQIIHFLHAVAGKNPAIKILGLTATANKHVEGDIHRQLFFSGQEGIVLRQSMSRPNIKLSVVHAKGTAAKLFACEALLKRMKGCGLIYCATRENTELVADYLQEKGLNVVAYHAGYDVERKRNLQQAFVQDKYMALAATNALGMGIDKSNLRFIIHFDFPGSITAYYQEVGRCGRDGKPAEGITIYDPSDCVIQNYFIQSSMPSQDDFKLILDTIANSPNPIGLLSIKAITGLHPTRVTIVIAELVEQGFLEKYSLDGKQVYRVLYKNKIPDLSRYTTQRNVKMDELKQMTRYGEQTEDCRMGILRKALGDVQPQPCGHCDCCLNTPQEVFEDKEKFSSISSWIDKRPVIIDPVVREKISAGVSILDSKIRSPLFQHFMKQRASPSESLGMKEALFDLLMLHLNRLGQNEKFAGLILIPSKTWQSRENVGNALGNALQIPVFGKTLEWREIPQKRQGELFNNDQRRENVSGKMLATPIPKKVGAIILFDDYIGSGSTIKEAARALRSAGIQNKLVPVTVAALKWHLGKPGFV